jgi:hypothetical protein
VAVRASEAGRRAGRSEWCTTQTPLKPPGSGWLEGNLSGAPPKRQPAKRRHTGSGCNASQATSRGAGVRSRRPARRRPTRRSRRC